MSLADSDNPDRQTLEYLLSVVTKNREQRCAQIHEIAHSQASEIIKQAHSSVRARMQHHIQLLREKYSERVSAAEARNQTLIRQHRQLADMQCLATAWPMLREAIKALWDDPVSRQQWLDAAIRNASSKLLKHDWRVEHPHDLSDVEQKRLQQYCTNMGNCTVELAACDDIEAGVRIMVDGTVIDATLEGLLQQKTIMQARLMSRVKQDIASHD